MCKVHYFLPLCQSCVSQTWYIAYEITLIGVNKWYGCAGVWVFTYLSPPAGGCWGVKITCPSMSKHDLVRLGVCPLSVDLLFLCVCVCVCAGYGATRCVYVNHPLQIYHFVFFHIKCTRLEFYVKCVNIAALCTGFSSFLCASSLRVLYTSQVFV